jgi:para-aminobenzoate synthetase component 1
MNARFRYNPYLTSKQILYWLAYQSVFTYLHSGLTGFQGDYAFIVGVCTASKPRFYSLEEAFKHNGWLFGYLSYEYKNELEPILHSGHQPTIVTPTTAFFEADIVIFRKKNNPYYEIIAEHPDQIAREINNMRVKTAKKSFKTDDFRSKFNKKSYIQTIKHLQEHIREGDVYEINLTQEFSAHFSTPLNANIVENLWENNPVPMASWLRMNDLMILSTSPERFLQKNEDLLRSEPIKGTVKRKKILYQDDLQKKLLQTEKFQAENVMIVDLVRNDLNRVCLPGTVHVPKLFRVDTYRHLHHLTSEITGTLSPLSNGLQAIKACFPAGSMTGAPKIRAMQLIDTYEPTARGIYSGAIGYLDPQKNFDFNVVIRTLVANLSSQIMSYHVGGAITIDSDPLAEYEESLLKARFVNGLLAQ